MAKTQEVNKDPVEQNPQGGGSYIRNEDGSLSVNEADLQKTKPEPEATGAESKKE